MGLLEALFERRADESRLSLTNYQEWLDLGITSRSASGISVTPTNAMKFSAVYACVRILAETVASLPLVLYERMERGKRRAERHYLYNILKDRPNEAMTSFEFRELLQSHLALWGNAYSIVDFDGAGRVRELWPLRPDHVRQIVKGDDGKLKYHYQMSTGGMQWFSEDIIWHLRGLGADGYIGYSPISLMRQAIGTGLAAEEFGARFFGNDARPGVILEHPGTLSLEAQEHLKDSWESKHGGLDKSHKVAILEEGMKLHEVGIPPQDAQFIETRKFQLQEIARIYRIPPHMLADLDRATFSNIEHQSIEYVVHTIRPWLVRWEQSIKQRLMLARDRERHFAEFLIDGLLRGDILSRYQAYGYARQNGWFSANDIRELENQNPIEHGDTYLVPLNMVPAEQVGGFYRGASGATENAQSDAVIREMRAAREERSALTRRRIQNAHKPLFQDVFARIYRREINDVGAAASKFLKTRAEGDFREWLQTFYEEHQQFIVDQGRAAFTALAEAIAIEAGDEVNSEAGSESVGNYVLAYLQALAGRQAANSQSRILDALDSDDALAVIEQEFERWRTDRPEITARDETVQVGNGAARLAYVMAGITFLKWRALGDSCPYCLALDGATVEIHQSFIPDGSSFQPDGADVPLIPSVNVGHPPLHSGCDCMVAPGY